jgi:hypothetical protein
LRIKHFHPGLVGWEEKDQSKQFVLVQRDSHTAIFLQRQVADPPWLIYHLEDDHTLVAYFESDSGEVAEHDKFIYTRR